MYGNEEEYESDYEDTELFSPSFKPSYVVIAIDTHPGMFQKQQTSTPFRASLEACYNLADSLIFTKDTRTWSPFAVMLTGESTPLIGFSKSILDTIKLLKDKLDLTDLELQQTHQRKGNLDLGEFFLTCKKIFHDVKTMFYKRTLIYISNDDRPIADKNSKFTALNEIKTFAAQQIEFQILPTIESFNYKYFYNELYAILGSKIQEEVCTDAEGLAQKLSSTILFKTNERKVLFYPFKGDSGRFLKCKRVQLFSNIQLTNSFMTTKGEKVINMKVPGDANPVYSIRYVGEGKAEGVHFDLCEKNAFQDFNLPKGITLLFVGDRQVELGHVFSKPNLIKVDPKEELPFFKKFWDNCVASNKVLVCCLKTRQPDRLRYAELIPVLINNQQMFLEKRLPYGNEIIWPAKIEYPEEEKNEERKLAIKELVNKLTFEFNPNMLPDVSLEKKKAYIRAKLLDAPMEEVEDVVLNREQLDLVLEDVVNDIREKFDLVVEEPKKRRQPQNAGPSRKKNK
ncbi:unnamed protein product [Psylliodes chrysocephalus]|uniref:Ku70/Ku80 N-terminal alpha/beta domain-containing protein n=1 Tax=Psylliodes chrysocephalus TaxID=3402493 RepID=A0A9P0CKB5_9CUCU|nr:unnamed protein product [Psylliodes chrysocephala]